MKTNWIKILAPAAVMGAAAIAGAPAMAQDDVRVVVNGSPVAFSGQGPVENGSHVLVPLRGVLEKLGAYVTYDSASQEVRAVRNESQIVLPIGGYTAHVDGNAVKLDVPATVLNGSTMVPLRFVAEALGASVDYSPGNRSVMIDTHGDGGGGHHDRRPPMEGGGPPMDGGNGRPPMDGGGDRRPVNVDAPSYRAGLIQGRNDRQAGLPAGYDEVLQSYLSHQKAEFDRGYRSGLDDARHDPTSIPRPAPRPDGADSASAFGYKLAQRDFLTKMPADLDQAWAKYRDRAEADYRAGYRAGRQG